MSEGQGFVLHPLAAQDIADIWEFLAEANLQAARRVREDILGAIRALVSFPHQGHRRTDLTSRPLLFRTVRDYLIAYATSGARRKSLYSRQSCITRVNSMFPCAKLAQQLRCAALVIAVLHGRRSPRVMAAILRARD